QCPPGCVPGRTRGSVISPVRGCSASHLRAQDPRVWLRVPPSSGMRDWPGVRVTRSRRDTGVVLAHGQPVVPPAPTNVDLAGHLTDEDLAGTLGVASGVAAGHTSGRAGP